MSGPSAQAAPNTSMAMQKPTKVFSFTGQSRSQPGGALPGDRVDAQFADHAAAITSTQDALDEIRRSDGKLANGIVTKDSLAPELLVNLSDDLKAAAKNDADYAHTAAADALVALSDATKAAHRAETAADKAEIAANEVRGGAGTALAAITEARHAADEAERSTRAAQLNADNSANDANYASALAKDWADVSVAWAEHMPDTIPPNILAVMGISGEHWSSRWWAHQADLSADRAEDAASAVVTIGHFYLGAYPSPPLVDPVTGTSQFRLGAVYYDTTHKGLFVWNGSNWANVTVNYTEGAEPLQTNIRIDTHWWVFDGVTKSFPLRDFGNIPVTPGDASGSIVSLDGVVQSPDTYSIVSDRIVFSVPPPANTTAWMTAGVILSTTTPNSVIPGPHTHEIHDVNGLETALASKQPVNINLTSLSGLTGNGTVVRLAGGFALDTTSYQPLDPDLTNLASMTGVGYVVRLPDGFALETSHFQPLDADLTAIASVSGTSGYLKKNADNSWSLDPNGGGGASVDLSLYAKLANPIFSGAPQTPTAAPYMNNLVVASTAHVYSTVTTLPENYHAENYTLALTDAGHMVAMDNVAARTITIPPFSTTPFRTNTRINLVQLGTGAVTLVAGAGVTIFAPNGDLTLGGRYNTCTLWNHSQNVWVLTRGQNDAAIAAKTDKSYVDAADAYLSGRIDGKLGTTGGTISDMLELGGTNPRLRFHYHGIVYWDMYAGGDGSFNLINNSGVWGMHRSTDGGMYFPGNVIAYWSDARLKKNIAPLDGYEERIMALRPVSFEWNDKGQELTHKKEGDRELGFIAQEVRDVDARFVAVNPTTNVEGEDPYLTVKKDELIADLVAQVQALTRRLRDIEGMLQ